MLEGVAVVVDAAELASDEPGERRVAAQPRDARRLGRRARAPRRGRIELRFRRSPVALLGDGHVEAIELVRNRLETRARRPRRRRPRQARSRRLDCGLVVRSVGYRGVPLPGVPFDERGGTIRNEGGRVAPGVYCAGWIKRGPSGVIGTNKKDAAETVGNLLADVGTGALVPRDGLESIDELLAARGVAVVDGERLGAESTRPSGRSAQPQGRPRVKLCRCDELLETALGLAGRLLTGTGVSRSGGQ